MLLSIDPGVRNAGVALWSAGPAGSFYLLESATLIEASGDRWLSLAHDIADWASNYALDQVIVEKPQVYVQAKLKGDPNDLVTLALAVGAIAMALVNTQTGFDLRCVYPREWKGQTPKVISVERSKMALTSTEHMRVRLPKQKSLHHNVWDAVGIGLWATRRS